MGRPVRQEPRHVSLPLSEFAEKLVGRRARGAALAREKLDHDRALLMLPRPHAGYDGDGKESPQGESAYAHGKTIGSTHKLPKRFVNHVGLTIFQLPKPGKQGTTRPNGR